MAIEAATLRAARTTRIAKRGDGWGSLYRAGAWSAIAMLVLIPIQLAVFIIWPLPTTVTEWFVLFQANPIAGLLDMDLLLIVDWILTVCIVVAFAIASSERERGLLVLAVTLEILAAAAYFASTGAFEMLSLAGRYDGASETERAALVAAGEMVLASWTGTAYIVSTVASGIAILLLSIAMLRSAVVGRLIPWFGIAMGVTAVVPPNAGTFGLVASLVYLVPFVGWLFLSAGALRRLAGDDGRNEAPTGIA